MNMITRQLNLSHLFLCLTFVIWQSGCAHQRPLLSEEIRAELGTIGVVSARFVPKVEIETPAAGSLSGMGRGAAGGAVRGFTSAAQLFDTPIPCSGFGCGGVLLLALAVIPISTIGGTLVGSVNGAVTAADAETVEEAEAALAHALDSLRMQEALRDHVLEEARNQTNYSIRVLNDRGPATRDETINYGALATQGIDTVLELGIESIGLYGELGVDPPLAILMKVRTKLLRTQDGALLYASTFPYQSGIHRFTEWAAHDSHLFREGLDSTYRTLAREIVEELFLLYRFPNR
jgi:hypothetical protein